MGGDNIDVIGEFDPATITPGSSILILGMRQSGKTVLVDNLLQHILPTVDVAAAFVDSDVEENRCAAQRHVDPIFVRRTSDLDIVQQIPKILSSRTNMPVGTTNDKEIQRQYRIPHACFIFENMFQTAAHDDACRDSILELLEQRRSLNATTIWVEQYVDNKVLTAARHEFDYVFVTGQSRVENFTTFLWCRFFPIFNTRYQFEAAWKAAVSGGYGSLVVDNMKQRNDISTTSSITKCVYWYRTTLVPRAYPLGRFHAPEIRKTKLNFYHQQPSENKNQKISSTNFIGLLKDELYMAAVSVRPKQEENNAANSAGANTIVRASSSPCVCNDANTLVAADNNAYPKHATSIQNCDTLPNLIFLWSGRTIRFDTREDVDKVKEMYTHDRKQCVKCIADTLTIPCTAGLRRLCDDMVRSCPQAILSDVLEYLRQGATFHPSYQSYLSVLNDAIQQYSSSN